VDAVLAHQCLGSLQELQGFLGMVNFYHQFFSTAAKLLRLLTEGLWGGKAAKKPIAGQQTWWGP
jgi:hypothetical protein